jgi:hypothetical protein
MQKLTEQTIGSLVAEVARATFQFELTLFDREFCTKLGEEGLLSEYNVEGMYEEVKRREALMDEAVNSLNTCIGALFDVASATMQFDRTMVNLKSASAHGHHHQVAIETIKLEEARQEISRAMEALERITGHYGA